MDRGQQPFDLGRVVLVVAVDLDGDVEPVAQRVAIADLDGATDAEVHGQADDRGPRPQGAPCRVVLGAVVHDDDVGVGKREAEAFDDSGDGTGLVEGRDDDADPGMADLGRPGRRVVRVRLGELP